MNTIEIIITIFGALGGLEAVKWLVYRKAEKRRTEADARVAEAEAAKSDFGKWDVQLDELRDELKEEREHHLAERALWKAEREELREDIRSERERYQSELRIMQERNKELMQQNIEKENRFVEQTKRLRECQDREAGCMSQIVEQTKRIGELDLELERNHCIKEHCPYKEPATDKTRKAREQYGICPSAEELPTTDPQPELTTN